MKRKSIIYFSLVLLLCILFIKTSTSTNRNDTTFKSDVPESQDIHPTISFDDQNNNNYFPANTDISLDNMQNLIVQIGSQPRSMNSDGILTAKNVLVNTLENYNYKINIQSFDIYKQDMRSTNVNTYAQDYFQLNPYDSELIGTGENIIASKDEDTNKPTLYITSHYDSTSNTYGIIDNASGTAVCIELARLLKDSNLNFNIVYVLFSSEEYYRYGSRYFVSQLLNNNVDNIIGCVNIDMIGQKNAGPVIAKTIFCRPNALSLAFEETIPLSHNDSGGLSDDLSFYFGQIPVIHLFNESADPTLLHGENEMDLLDLEQLGTTVSNILSMLNNFEINDYYKLINSEYCEMHTDFKENYLIGNYKLEELKYHLIDNGYSSQIECKFVYGEKKIRLLESDQRFYNGDTTLCTENLLNEHIWYHYLNTTNEMNEIFYGSIYYPSIGGTMQTNLSESEITEFLKKRYDNFENTIVKGFTFDEYIKSIN